MQLMINQENHEQLFLAMASLWDKLNVPRSNETGNGQTIWTYFEKRAIEVGIGVTRWSVSGKRLSSKGFNGREWISD